MIADRKSLLLKLMSLNSGDLNPELNADIDDFLVDNDCSKRVSRRIKRGYYNALARECLKGIEVDPLNVFGEKASHVIYNMSKVSFSEIGEFKIGNKIFRVRENAVDTRNSTL